jgi:hypothetical protein
MFAATLAGCLRQQPPFLSDTVLWMAQTYNPRKNGFGGHGSYMDEELSYRETFGYKGCEITTVTASSLKGDQGWSKGSTWATKTPIRSES